MALLRYPGSKEKLAPQITRLFPQEMVLPLNWDSNRWEYREPFFGAGAVGFLLLRDLPPSCSIWLNDKDYGIVCLWQAVWRSLDELVERIEGFEPSVEKYEEYKAKDGDLKGDPLEVGFRKLALHQMSYSGLGYKSGGPLGGREQNNGLYSVDCRWLPESLYKEAVDLHEVLTKFKSLKITCKDFSVLMDDNPRAFIYCDPPYVDKGPELYRHAFAAKDHTRLAGLLHSTKSYWALSYDDHPLVRKLYAWARFQELQVTYTAATAINGTRPKNKEVLITPPSQAIGTLAGFGRMGASPITLKPPPTKLERVKVAA